MLRVAICDDDMAICEWLKGSIEQVQREGALVQDVAVYGTADELWQMLQAGERFDLLFLDVNLPGMDGIELGEKIRQTSELELMSIVYISADSGYAMALYDNYPLRFLTKDDKLTVDNVQDVLMRAEQLTQSRQENFTFIKDRLLFQVPINDIVYLESQRKLIALHQTDGSVTTFAGKLDDVAAQLGAKRFLRIHKSYLVNMDAIYHIAPDTVHLHDGTKLPISKTYQKSAAKWLKTLSGGVR